MILVVGGIGSGKRDWVLSQLALDASSLVDARENVSCERFARADVVDHAEELVRTLNPQVAFEQLRGRRAVVLSEVGAGIVPLDPQDAAWREDVGRLGCLLAVESSHVVRMTCGIAQIIKGDASELGQGGSQ